MFEEDGVWRLVGDASWEGQGDKPGVYGNVSHFLSWIHRQMKVRHVSGVISSEMNGVH